MARSTEIYNRLMLLKSRPAWGTLPLEKQMEIEDKYKAQHSQALAEERELVPSQPEPESGPYQLQLKTDTQITPKPGLDFGALRDKLREAPKTVEPDFAPQLSPDQGKPIDSWLQIPGEAAKSAARIPFEVAKIPFNFGGAMVQSAGKLTGIDTLKDLGGGALDMGAAINQMEMENLPRRAPEIKEMGDFVKPFTLASNIAASGPEVAATMYLPTRLSMVGQGAKAGAAAKLAKDLGIPLEEAFKKLGILQRLAPEIGGFAGGAMTTGSAIAEGQHQNAGEVDPLSFAVGTGLSGALESIVPAGFAKLGADDASAAVIAKMSRPEKIFRLGVVPAVEEFATETLQSPVENIAQDVPAMGFDKAMEKNISREALPSYLFEGLMGGLMGGAGGAMTLRSLPSGSGKSFLEVMKDPKATPEAQEEAFKQYSALSQEEQSLAMEQMKPVEPPAPSPIVQQAQELGKKLAQENPPVKSDSERFPARELGKKLAQPLPNNITPAPVVNETPVKAPETPQVKTEPPATPQVDMQNRDRSRASSVEQMESIAENPDYGRLSVSRSVDVGAPLVSAKGNAAVIPDTDLGAQDVATFADGKKLPFRYGVVEADQVKTSHNAQGQENPDYKNSQPGDLVALTNGRVAGLQEAHLRRNANDYVKGLLADPAHGVSPESISSKKKPVLVRVYDDSANVGLMGRNSNQRYGMELSPSEQAVDDAKLLAPLLQNLEFEDDGRLRNSGKNKEAFLTHLSKVVPQSELNRVVTKDGNALSDAGLNRIENAAVAMAYQSPTLVESMTENRSDSNVKTVMNGLVRSAPDAAQLNLEIERGQVFPVSLAPDLSLAAEKLSKLRSEKAVKDYLSQGVMEGDNSSPVSRMLMGFFAQTRSSKAIGELIKGFNDTIRAIGSPKQMNLFEETPTPTVESVLERTINTLFPELAPEMARYKQGPTVLMSRSRSKPGEPVQGSFDTWLNNLESKNPQAASEIRKRLPRPGKLRDIDVSNTGGSFAQEAEEKAGDKKTVSYASFAYDGKKVQDAAIELAKEKIDVDPGKVAFYVGWDFINQKAINTFFHVNAQADQKMLGPAAEILNNAIRALGGESIMTKEGGDEWGHVILVPDSVTREKVEIAIQEGLQKVQEYGESIGLPLDLENDRAKYPHGHRANVESLEMAIGEMEKAGLDVKLFQGRLENAKKEYLSDLRKYLSARGFGYRFGVEEILPTSPISQLYDAVGMQHDAQKKGAENNVQGSTFEAAWLVGPSGRRDSAKVESSSDGKPGSERRIHEGTPRPESPNESGRQASEVEPSTPEPSAAPAQEALGALPSPEKKPTASMEDLENALRKMKGLPPIEKKVVPFTATNINGHWFIKDPAGNIIPGFATTSELAAKMKAQVLSMPVPEAAQEPAQPAPSPVPEKPETKPETPEKKTGIQDFGEKIGGARKDLEPSATPRKTGPKTEDSRPTWAKRYNVFEITGSMNPEENGKFGLYDRAKKEALRDPNNRWRDRIFNTREEAEAALPLFALARNHRVIPAGGGKFEIIRDVTDRKRVVLKSGFDTEIDAKRYMAEHAVELLETKTGFGEEILLAPEKAMRRGVPRRETDATPEMFMETFAPRGIEFGNWNNQLERQEVLNHAYDGLLDLADLLDIPPQALFLNGDLALAFGARGQGLSGARAHYEADYGVINLTKMQGAGSLAHEWFHALDHYLSRQDTKSPQEKTVNSLGDKVYSEKDIGMASRGFSRAEGLRAELKAALKNVLTTIDTKAEKFVEDTQKAEKWVGAARDDLQQKLTAIRNYLAKEYPYTRKKAPATPEQLAKFDAISEKLANGEALETKLTAIEGAKTRSPFGTMRRTNDTLEALNDLMKEVRGRGGFNSEHTGELNDLSARMSIYAARIQMMKDAAAGTEKEKRIPTEFKRNAKTIDQGRVSDYWTQPEEMASRAFSAYVEDKIAERGGQSDFLSFGSDNKYYRLEGIRPFPEGDERAAINAAFDNLVSVMQTKETEKGVAIYSKESDYVSQESQRADDSIPGASERTRRSEDAGEDTTSAPSVDRSNSGRDSENRGLPVSDESGRTLRTLEEVIAREEKDQGFIGAFREVTDLETSQKLIRDAFQSLFGKEVVFFEDHSPDAKAHGGESMVNGVIVHELFPDTIFVNAKSKRIGTAIAGHELLHMIQKDSPEIYQRLNELLEKEIQDFPKFLERLRARGGNTQDLAGAKAELYGDFLGDQLLRPEFWSRLVKKNPTVFEKVVEVFNRFLNMVKSFFRGYDSEGFFNDLEKSREAMANAVSEYAQKRQSRGPLAKAVALIGKKPVTQRNTFAEGLAKLGNNFPDRPSEDLAFDDPDKWNQDQKKFQADLKAWSGKAPDILQFGRGKDMMVVVSKNTRTNEDSWRMTWFHKRNDEWIPTGHQAYPTKADAVSDASHYGPYRPDIRFSKDILEKAQPLFSRNQDESAISELQKMVDKKQLPPGVNPEEAKTFWAQAQELLDKSIGRIASEIAMDDPAFRHAQSRDGDVRTAEEMLGDMKQESNTKGGELEDKILAAHIRADTSSVIATITNWTKPGPLQDWLLKKVRRVLAPIHAADKVQRLLFNIAERVYWDGEKMVASPGFRQRDDSGKFVYLEDGIPSAVALKAFENLSPEWQKVLTDRAKENEQFRQDFIRKWVPKMRAETGIGLMGKILRDLQTITDKGERAELFRLWEGDPNAQDEVRKMGIVNATEGLLADLADEIQGDEAAEIKLEALGKQFETLKSSFNLDNSRLIGYLDREIENSKVAWRSLLSRFNNLKNNLGHFGYVHHTGYDNPGVNDPGSGFNAADIYRHPWFEEVPGTLKGRDGRAGFQENLIMADIAKGRKTIRADARNEWMKTAEDKYGLTQESVTDPENPDKPPQLPEGYDIKSNVVANFGRYGGQKIYLPTKLYELYKMAVDKGTVDPDVREVSEALGTLNDAVSMVNEAMLWHPGKFMRDLFSMPFHLMEFLTDWSFKNPYDAKDLPGLLLDSMRKSMTPAEWQRQTPESKGEYSESLYFTEKGNRHWLTWGLDQLSEKYKPGTTLGALFRQINLAGAGDLPIKRIMTSVGEGLADKRKLTGLERERFIRRVVNEYAYETSDLPPLLKWVRGLSPSKDSKIAGVVSRFTVPFMGYAFRLAQQMLINPFVRGWIPIGKRALKSQAPTRYNVAEATRPLKWIALAALVQGGMGGLLPPDDEEVAGGLQNRPGVDPRTRTASRQLIMKDAEKEGGEYYLSLKGLAHYSVADSILRSFKGKQKFSDMISEFISIHPVTDSVANILGYESPYGRGIPTETKLGRLTAMLLFPQFTRLGPDVAKILRSVGEDESIQDDQKKTFFEAFASQLGAPEGEAKMVKGVVVTTKKWIEHLKLVGINVRYIPYTLVDAEAKTEVGTVAELGKKLAEMNNPNRPWEKMKNKDGTTMTETQYLIKEGMIGRGRTIDDAREQLRRDLEKRVKGLSQTASELKKLGFSLRGWDKAKTDKLVQKIYGK